MKYIWIKKSSGCNYEITQEKFCVQCAFALVYMLIHLACACGLV